MVDHHQHYQLPQNSTRRALAFLRWKKTPSQWEKMLLTTHLQPVLLWLKSADRCSMIIDRRLDFNFLQGDPSPCLIFIQCISPSSLHHEMTWRQLRAFCFLISNIYDYGNIYDAWRGLGSGRRLSLCCPCKWDLSPACFCQSCKTEECTSYSLGWPFFFPI